GDTDVFSIVAPVTGAMTVQQSANPFGNGLNSFLTVFDSSHRPIASNDDSNGTLDSSVQFQVTAGQTYYIQAGASDQTTGAYQLTIATLAPSSTPIVPRSAIKQIPGFTFNAMPPNDDSSTGSVPVGFDLNFFGAQANSVYVNNNGNVTLHAPLSDYI